ncbi:MAG TPA: 4Fe-4S dicluster domain-containing protein, partial [bacterium (Candidatus Stahlbacteria)]|nr:4Fe-4S dicluster domain-containing protein [Candidatus Stahlbacteria bacterium]
MMAKIIRLDTEIRDEIISHDGQQIQKCYGCGRCMTACPWNHLERVEYPIFRYPQSIRIGEIISSEEKQELEKEVIDIFRCVGCESCLRECPRGVNIADVLRAVRRVLVEYSSYPDEFKALVSLIKSSGNPLGEPEAKRTNWRDGLDIPDFREGFDYLYNPCCVPSYDARAQKVARATASILKKAGVSFGILDGEVCCGEAVRRVG